MTTSVLPFFARQMASTRSLTDQSASGSEHKTADPPLHRYLMDFNFGELKRRSAPPSGALMCAAEAHIVSPGRRAPTYGNALLVSRRCTPDELITLQRGTKATRSRVAQTRRVGRSPLP